MPYGVRLSLAAQGLTSLADDCLIACLHRHFLAKLRLRKDVSIWQQSQFLHKKELRRLTLRHMGIPTR
jgi:hypothetical protein